MRRIGYTARAFNVWNNSSPVHAQIYKVEYAIVVKHNTIGVMGDQSSNNLIQKVRLALLSPCNLRCTYCRPGGEGSVGSAKSLDISRVLFFAKVFRELQCTKLNLTGGEPFLHRKLGEICDQLVAETGYNISVNTNGTIPLARHPKLKAFDKLNLVVSLDATSTAKLAKTGRLTKFEIIDRFIQDATERGFSIRINSVIVKGVNDTESDISNLIEYSIKRRVDLKIQSVFDISEDMFFPATSQYSSLNICHKLCLQFGFEFGGHLNVRNGVTEKTYLTPNATRIRILDKDYAATRYGSPCQKCSLFPCDTGLYAYYITEDERLLLCRTRRETIFNFQNKSDELETAKQLSNELNNLGYNKVFLRTNSIEALHPHHRCHTQSHENSADESL